MVTGADSGQGLVVRWDARRWARVSRSAPSRSLHIAQSTPPPGASRDVPPHLGPRVVAVIGDRGRFRHESSGRSRTEGSRCTRGGQRFAARSRPGAGSDHNHLASNPVRSRKAASASTLPVLLRIGDDPAEFDQRLSSSFGCSSLPECGRQLSSRWDLAAGRASGACAGPSRRHGPPARGERRRQRAGVPECDLLSLG